VGIVQVINVITVFAEQSHIMSQVEIAQNMHGIKIVVNALSRKSAIGMHII
jgi:hypothetical protein